jgi:thioesterase domain-containing protein
MGIITESVKEGYEGKTVHQRPEFVPSRTTSSAALPPGVIPIRPAGPRNSVFWIHYPCLDLAKELGENQPFFFVMLTAEDCASLGKEPTLQSIGACLLRKILATQPNGPYSLGGYCLGGVLAYEIAYQLKDLGHEVSLLVMLDPPNPSSEPTCDTLSNRAKYAGYLLKRAMRLGVRTSWVYLQERLNEWLARASGRKPALSDARVAQEMSETAMFRYQPEKYDGKVLLLLAAERPPHVNFLPGWEALITGKLHLQYLDAHHRDLAKAKNVRVVAEIIASRLAVANLETTTFPRRTGNSRLSLIPAMSRSSF